MSTRPSISIISKSIYTINVSSKRVNIEDTDVIFPKNNAQITSDSVMDIPLKKISCNSGRVVGGLTKRDRDIDIDDIDENFQIFPKLTSKKLEYFSLDSYKDISSNTVELRLTLPEKFKLSSSHMYVLSAIYSYPLSSDSNTGPLLNFSGAIQPSDYKNLETIFDIEYAKKYVELVVHSLDDDFLFAVNVSGNANAFPLLERVRKQTVKTNMRSDEILESQAYVKSRNLPEFVYNNDARAHYFSVAGFHKKEIQNLPRDLTGTL